jgi:hypothetical protein
MTESPKFRNRDTESSKLKSDLINEGLTYVNETIDYENFDKKLSFQYLGVNIRVGVRVSSTSFYVQVYGDSADILFTPLPYTMSKTKEGIRIGKKGTSYPKTRAHAIDQIRYIKKEIKERYNERS